MKSSNFKNSKRLWALSMAACLSVMAVGCGKDPASSDKDNDNSTTASDTDKPSSSNNDNNAAVIDSISDVSFKLFNSYYSNADSKNIVLSPLSAEMLTAMVYESTNGDTKTQIADTLGIDDAYCVKLRSAMSSQDDILKMSNHIRLVEAYESAMKSDYRELLTESYKASIGKLDSNSVDEINGIVSKETDGLIGDILKQGDLDGVDVFEMNCCAFNGEWVTPFNGAREAVFRDNDNYYLVDMLEDTYTNMRTSSDVKYIESNELGCYGITKDYVDSNGNEARYKFVGLLPDEGKRLSDVIAKLSGDAVEKMINSDVDYWTIEADDHKLDVMIPKFKIDNKFSVDELYKSMGVTNIFSDQADMSKGFDSALHVDKIDQVATIELNEMGTKAAAVTYATCEGAALERTEAFIRQVYFNRPFVYMIYDTKTNSVAFIGTVGEFEEKAAVEDVKKQWLDDHHTGMVR